MSEGSGIRHIALEWFCSSLTNDWRLTFGSENVLFLAAFPYYATWGIFGNIVCCCSLFVRQFQFRIRGQTSILQLGIMFPGFQHNDFSLCTSAYNQQAIQRRLLYCTVPPRCRCSTDQIYTAGTAVSVRAHIGQIGASMETVSP